MKIRILLFAMLALAVAGSAYAHRGGGCPGQRGHAAKDCSSPKECLDQARCGGQNGHGGHYQGFMADLTPEQQEKVRKATDKHHEELFALQKELKNKEQALDSLFAATPADKAAVQKLVKEINMLQSKKTELNAAYRLELTEITGKPLPSASYGSGCSEGRGHRPCPQGGPTT